MLGGIERMVVGMVVCIELPWCDVSCAGGTSYSPSEYRDVVTDVAVCGDCCQGCEGVAHRRERWSLALLIR